MNGSQVRFFQRIVLSQMGPPCLGCHIPTASWGQPWPWLSDRNIQRPALCLKVVSPDDRICVPELPMGGTNLKPIPAETTSALLPLTLLLLWLPFSWGHSPQQTMFTRTSISGPALGTFSKTKTLLLPPFSHGCYQTDWKWIIHRLCIECIQKLEVLGNEIQPFCEIFV